MPPVRASPRRHRLEQLRQCKREHEMRRPLALAAVIGSIAVILTSAVDPEPKHTSILTGQMWLEDVLFGHYEQCYSQFGVSVEIFFRLLIELSGSGLHDTRFVSAAEQLAIFLYFAQHGASQRALMERFQHSADTISRCIHRITNLLVSNPFYNRYVRDPLNATPPQIWNNPKLYPYFRHALGAIDGSHVAAYVLAEDIPRYRSRKGMISQNVLAVCNWFMLFTYVLAGWEGSAADSGIFESARRNGAFKLGLPWYFLADAGFPICDTLLVPYRNTRYHLKEWYQASRLGGATPENYKELFNLRHAQARNIIECIFGVFKRRFKLLTQPLEYPVETQAKFVVALSALFNFIRTWDPSEIDSGVTLETEEPLSAGRSGDADEEDEEELSEPIFGGISTEETARATERRERIAKAMWDDYVRYREGQ